MLGAEPTIYGDISDMYVYMYIHIHTEPTINVSPKMGYTAIPYNRIVGKIKKDNDHWPRDVFGKREWSSCGFTVDSKFIDP